MRPWTSTARRFFVDFAAALPRISHDFLIDYFTERDDSFCGSALHVEQVLYPDRQGQVQRLRGDGWDKTGLPSLTPALCPGRGLAFQMADEETPKLLLQGLRRRPCHDRPNLSKDITLPEPLFE